jgi:hypothetical protein
VRVVRNRRTPMLTPHPSRPGSMVAFVALPAFLILLTLVSVPLRIFPVGVRFASGPEEPTTSSAGLGGSDVAASPAPECPRVTVRSHRVFHYEFANEWGTGHLLLVGCAGDAAALREIAEGAALDSLQQLAEHHPGDVPLCRHGEAHPALVAQLNREYGRAVVLDGCADVVADI